MLEELINNAAIWSGIDKAVRRQPPCRIVAKRADLQVRETHRINRAVSLAYLRPGPLIDVASVIRHETAERQFVEIAQLPEGTYLVTVEPFKVREVPQWCALNVSRAIHIRKVDVVEVDNINIKGAEK